MHNRPFNESCMDATFQRCPMHALSPSRRLPIGAASGQARGDGYVASASGRDGPHCRSCGGGLVGYQPKVADPDLLIDIQADETGGETKCVAYRQQ